jgi:hypothetical protein
MARHCAARADDAGGHCRDGQAGLAGARGRCCQSAAGSRRRPLPADVSPSTATAHGADIGTALTMKALHARWSGLRAAHPALFDGLQPLVSLKQNPRTNRTELHLVVGPYSNADAAAQFCDFVLPFHLACQPAMFDGSRLALQ